jgi:hypothetical protein
MSDVPERDSICRVPFIRYRHGPGVGKVAGTRAAGFCGTGQPAPCPGHLAGKDSLFQREERPPELKVVC